MKHKATWKNVEKAIAKKLRLYWEHIWLAEFPGIDRVPITGRNRGSAPDIAHPVFSIEVKHRAKLPKWLKDDFDRFTECSIWSALGVGVYACRLDGLKNVSDMGAMIGAKWNNTEPFTLTKRLPDEFRDAFMQAAASDVKTEEKIGLVILHEKGMKYDDCLVFLISPGAMYRIREEFQRTGGSHYLIP